MKKIILVLILSTAIFTIRAQTPQKESAKNVASANPLKSVATSGNLQLNGVFSAPAGTGIVLQNNGKSDLSLSTPKESGKTYVTNKFTFPGTQLKDAKFKVSVKKIIAGQTCVVYAGADGVISENYGKPKIGTTFKRAVPG